MKKLKYIIIFLAVVVIMVMAVATCVENKKGAEFVSANVYGTWWFVLLWAILAFTSIIYMLKMGLRKRLPVFLLHISFLVILAGALTTYLTSERGSLHLRKGESVTTFLSADSTSRDLGFALTLNNFAVEYYPGTDSPMDYVSHLEADGTGVDISMNNIGRFRGFRFTQAGYDDDMQGSSLRVLYDPWGIALTYIGYALLLISMVVLLCGRSTQLYRWYRKALESNSLKMAVVLLFSGLSLCAGAAEPRCVDHDVTEAFAKVAVYYNGRVCPVNTVAIDFVTKLSGKASWKDYDADEIFAGWTFNSSAWESVPMIRIKDKVAQKAMGIKGLVCQHRGDIVRSESLAALAHFLLYPAVFLFAAGIFIGAVWANVSWGRYWSWDPKEVWALVTMLIYMAPFHSSSIKCFRNTRFFLFYCIVAFLSVLITYFGVNFLLGGMHSYA